MPTDQNHSSLSRRDFLITGAASVASIGLLGAGCMQEKTNRTAKAALPVGLQLYSVRANCAEAVRARGRLNGGREVETSAMTARVGEPVAMASRDKYGVTGIT